MSAKSNLKFIGIFLFLIGFGFIFVNFLYPHTSSVEKSVQVPYQVTVPNERLIASDSSRVLTSNQYWYYGNISINAGETFKMTWSADTSITGYIFTNNQYNNFASNHLSFNVNCEATGSGKTGTITCDVKDRDNFVALLKNGGSLLGGSSVQLYTFTISKITYSSQTEYTTETQTVEQDDNLYLYLGFGLVIVGICVFSVLQKVYPAVHATA